MQGRELIELVEHSGRGRDRSGLARGIRLHPGSRLPGTGRLLILEVAYPLVLLGSFRRSLRGLLARVVRAAAHYRRT